MESDFIMTDTVEATEFPDLVGRYRVSAVPTTVVNGTPAIRGAPPEEAFLEQVLRSVTTATESAAVAAPGRGARR
jgi:predicted DsbA family dithiol-disulfide isomerase